MFPERKRDLTIDVLRGLAVLMMVCGNLPTVLFLEYYPFWLVLCNAWAAPFFIMISGMMVVFTAQTREHRLKYFLARGVLLIIVGLLIEVFMLGGYPFMFFQILYLIGVSLPIAYLFSHLNALSRWITVIVFFLLHPLLQETLKHADHLVHRFIVDGWFPVFPWLGFSLLGVNLAFLRWGFNSPTIRRKRLAFLGSITLTFGSLLWGLTFHLYPWPSIGYVVSAVGVMLTLLPIVDYKPSFILYKPLQVLGEAPLFMYILHLSLLHYVVAATWSHVNLETFLLIYITVSLFMVLVACGLRILKDKWRSRPFIVRFFLGG
ncbi:MAG: heparan-alpha-glucosaminide N-acetyltransferase domain-containing protein [Nitrososphaerota archaeon]|nr:heparan-alpha-glucosaminide N-acetyltransferase domain-containing protein [Nitrososphaerota archaeon]